VQHPPSRYLDPGPQIRVLTPIWHPHFNDHDGRADVNFGERPLSLETIVLNLRVALASPGADSPGRVTGNCEAALQLRTDPAAFEARARADTERFAMD
jgi:ubiquitin-protein ligase